jgi:hypothetical protein
MKTYSTLVCMLGQMTELGNSAGFGLANGTGVAVPAPEGLKMPGGAVLEAPEGEVIMETRAFVQNEQMWESGRFTFTGIDSYVDVTTQAPAGDHPLPEGHSYGSASCYITGGGGKFAGATGIMTGNFVGAPDGSFIDWQFFLIQLP